MAPPLDRVRAPGERLLQGHQVSAVNVAYGSKSPVHSILTERQLSVWSDARL